MATHVAPGEIISYLEDTAPLGANELRISLQVDVSRYTSLHTALRSDIDLTVEFQFSNDGLYFTTTQTVLLLAAFTSEEIVSRDISGKWFRILTTNLTAAVGTIFRNHTLGSYSDLETIHPPTTVVLADNPDVQVVEAPVGTFTVNIGQAADLGDATAMMINSGQGSAADRADFGPNDTAYGNDALLHGSKGFDNTALGANALKSRTGLGVLQKNTAVGAGAMELMQTGTHNTCLGNNAGSQATAFTTATIVGCDAVAGVAANPGDNSISIGFEASKSGSGNQSISIGTRAANLTGNNNLNCISIGHECAQTIAADGAVSIGNGCASTIVDGRLAFGSAMELPEVRSNLSIEAITDLINVEWNGTHYRIPACSETATDLELSLAALGLLAAKTTDVQVISLAPGDYEVGIAQDPSLGLNSMYVNGVVGSKGAPGQGDTVYGVNAQQWGSDGFNTSMGFNALGGGLAVIGGSKSRNVAMGNRALEVLDAGVDNVAIGYRAGVLETNFTETVLVGAGAGSAGNIGDESVFIGHAAGSDQPTNIGAIGVGAFSASSGAVGEYSVSMGHLSNAPRANQVSIGAGCVGDALGVDGRLAFGSAMEAPTTITAVSPEAPTGLINLDWNGTTYRVPALSSTATDLIALPPGGAVSVTTLNSDVQITEAVPNNFVVGIGQDLGLGANSMYINGVVGSKGAAGTNDTVFGINAQKNGSGGGNTSMGYQTLGGALGALGGVMTDNVVIGDRAGSFFESGADNVFIGNSAARIQDNCSSTVCIGSGAGSNGDIGDNSVIIGNGAGTSFPGGAGSVMIGGGAGNLGVVGVDSVSLGRVAYAPRANQVSIGAGCVGDALGVDGRLAFGSAMEAPTAITAVSPEALNGLINMEWNGTNYRIPVLSTTATDFASGAAAPALSTVLTTGNTTGGMDILMSAGDEILGAANISVKAFSQTGLNGNGGSTTISAGGSGSFTGVAGNLALIAPNGSSGGGSVTMTAGTVSGTGNGGSTTISSGGSGSTGNGGFLNLTAGSGNTSGGSVNITAGDGPNVNPGHISLVTGDGFTSGGNISLTCGDSSDAVGGAISLTAGDSGVNGAGGGISLTAGNGGSSGVGGSISLTAGEGDQDEGGGVTITSTDGSFGIAKGGDIILHVGGTTGNHGELRLYVGAINYKWPTDAPVLGDRLTTDAAGLLSWEPQTATTMPMADLWSSTYPAASYVHPMPIALTYYQLVFGDTLETTISTGGGGAFFSKFATGELRYLGPDQKGQVSVSLSCDVPAGVAQEYGFKLYKNGVFIPGTQYRVEEAGLDVFSFTARCMTDMTLNDTFSLWISNFTSTTSLNVGTVHLEVLGSKAS